MKGRMRKAKKAFVNVWSVGGAFSKTSPPRQLKLAKRYSRYLWDDIKDIFRKHEKKNM